jgi:hypothetical protein
LREKFGFGEGAQTMKYIAVLLLAIAVAAPVYGEELSIAPGDQPITEHLVLSNGPSIWIPPGPLDHLQLGQGSGLNGLNTPHLPPFTLNISTTSAAPFIAAHPSMGNLMIGRSFNPFALPMPTMYRFGFGFRR